MPQYCLLPSWITISLLASIVLSSPARSQPSTTGQTGLINMPDARIEEDGTFRLGTSHFSPYTTIWSSVSLLPRVELSGRYTIIQGLSSGLGQGFGDYKDKAFDAKGMILKEDKWWPDFSLG